MSNLWVNIRIGVRHLQIGRGGISFRVNPYHVGKPRSWIEVYQVFGWHSC